jgi:penicillin-binding protein A
VVRRLWLTAICSALAWVAPAQAAPRVDMSKLRIRDGGLVAPRRDGRLLPLTLRPRLQERVRKLLANSRAPSGAIVVADVATGEILAWATRGSGRDLVAAPLYPPASVTKVVTAAALLEGQHVFRPTAQCYGGGLRGLTWDDVRSSCRQGESKMPFGEALGYSINIIFGRLAHRHLVGPDLSKIAHAVGFSGAPQIDLALAASTIAWPERGLALAQTAAGFSRTAKIAPLSVLSMMHTIARRGERLPFRVLETTPLGKPTRAIRQSTANALVRMLEVTTRRGTSKKAFAAKPGRPDYRAAGKTGTLTIGPPSRMLSWFAGFAPSRKPEIAVAVMLANDLAWWRKGNQVARDVMDAYFDARNEDSRRAAEPLARSQAKARK